MNNEKIKLMLKLAQENQDLNIDDLVAIASVNEQPKQTSNELVISKPLSARRNQTLTRKAWTTGDESRLIYMYNNGYGNKEIAVNLDRTAKAINSKISKLKSEGRIKTYGVKKPYEKYEKDFIYELSAKYNFETNNIPNEEIKELSELLNRTSDAIRTQLYAVQKGAI